MTDNLLSYDVAISFAGEDRLFAEGLAKELKLNGLSIFYDNYEMDSLWGKDLYVHLTNVYRDLSKYCLMVISESYTKKQWTSHERKAAQARAFSENREYILPLRLDDTRVDGILETTGFVDARKMATSTIVEMLRKKVSKYDKDSGINHEVIKAEDALDRAGIKLPNGLKVKDTAMETTCPSCETKQLLSEAPIKLHGDETAYECKHGCQIIVVIGRPKSSAWKGRGYRLNDYVIRNVRDLFLNINANGPGVLIPASQSALMTQQPGSVDQSHS